MMLAAWIVTGGGIAAMLAALLRRSRNETSLWAMALVVAALIYPAFALGAGGPSAAPQEFLGSLPWIAVAIASRGFGPSLLAAGWAAHGVWDMMPVNRPWMPDFYPPLCLGFDLVVAVRLVALRYSR
jgi:hypothetical protein